MRALIEANLGIRARAHARTNAFAVLCAYVGANRSIASMGAAT